jgi:hypothetical protein
MDKKRLEIIITIALILILIFAWANSLKVLKKKSSPPAALGPASLPIETGVYPGQEKEKSPQRNLVWARCPFSGKIYTEKEAAGIAGLKLDGILWDKQKPIAIIAGQVVEIGGKVEGNIVVDIKEDRVILSNGSNNFELKLGR